MESLYLFFIAFIGIMGSYITWQQYRPPQKITWHNIPLSITIILISIMLAIRCYASDWCQYYSLFLQYQTGYDPLREPEFLWQGITRCLAATGMSVQLYFVIMFALQLYLFFRVIRKNFPFLLPFAAAVYLITDMMNGSNIMRHWTAILIFLNAIPYIEKRKLLPYTLLFFIASGFHKSIWLFFPLYWILNYSITSNIKIQLSIIFISLIFGQTLILLFLRIITSWMPTGYYDFYANQGEELQLNKGHVSSGLGILLYYLCNLSVVIYSNVLKRYYRKYHFYIFYKAFFYGQILYSALYKAGDSARLSAYLYYTHPFLIAFLLHYLWKHRQNTMYLIWFVALCFMLLAPYLLGLFNKEELIFFWNMQNHLRFMYELNNHRY